MQRRAFRHELTLRQAECMVLGNLATLRVAARRPLHALNLSLLRVQNCIFFTVALLPAQSTTRLPAKSSFPYRASAMTSRLPPWQVQNVERHFLGRHSHCQDLLRPEAEAEKA